MHKGILEADRCTIGDYRRKEDAAFLALDIKVAPVLCSVHCRQQLRTGLIEDVHFTHERCIHTNAQLSTLKDHGYQHELVVKFQTRMHAFEACSVHTESFEHTTCRQRLSMLDYILQRSKVSSV